MQSSKRLLVTYVVFSSCIDFQLGDLSVSWSFVNFCHLSNPFFYSLIYGCH